ncbi:MAG: hypothetical protein EOP61_04905 [Sphingomonadales bacterium]|nr:MAG: hypothetical protein EOP61_04905 [Sphingomonadales bacterium]
MMRLIAAILPLTMLTVPASSIAAEREGVPINSMWDFMGTLTYSSCLLKEYGFVPATAPEREKLLSHAVKACEGAVSRSFKDAKMNGSDFPPFLIQLAEQIAPQVRAYMFPILRDLPPSQTETRKRVRLMIVGKDGKGYEIPSEKNSKIPENAIFYVEIVSEAAAQ